MFCVISISFKMRKKKVTIKDICW